MEYNTHYQPLQNSLHNVMGLIFYNFLIMDISSWVCIGWSCHPKYVVMLKIDAWGDGAEIIL